MATCDMGYEHADAIPEPEPVAVPVVPGTNDADVEIARIDANASVKREQEYTKQRESELAAENAELRGQIEGMQATLAALQPPEPEPEPEPVIVEPTPEPEPESTPAPPETTPPPSQEKKKAGYWDAYR